MKNHYLTIAKVFLILGISLSFFACAKPSFNPNNKAIQFVKGKPYLIPYQTRYFPLTLSMSDVYLFKKKGVASGLYQVLWIVPEEFSKLRGVSDDAFHTIVASLIKKNKAGFVSAMTNQEYDFYSKRETQKRQMKHERDMQSHQDLIKTLKNISEPSPYLYY